MGRDLLTAARCAVVEHGFEEIVFVDDRSSGPVLGLPVLHPSELLKTDAVVIAVADGRVRQQIANRLANRFASIKAPTVVIGADVKLGEGGVICDFSILTTSSRIGRHFQCNVHGFVAHDCVISDFVTFAPRVTCNGNVHIHEGAYIGANAVIKQGMPEKPLVIGVGAVVGMGAVVTKDVQPGSVVVGNPARIMASRS